MLAGAEEIVECVAVGLQIGLVQPLVELFLGDLEKFGIEPGERFTVPGGERLGPLKPCLGLGLAHVFIVPEARERVEFLELDGNLIAFGEHLKEFRRSASGGSAELGEPFDASLKLGIVLVPARRGGIHDAEVPGVLGFDLAAVGKRRGGK